MNYAELPEVKEAIERIKSRESEPDSMAGFFLYEPGKKLELEVEVTDPEIARAVLGSSFVSNNLMPGMKILNIRFGDFERKDVLKAWLQDQLSKLSQPE